jgi:D-psicose/D-tagatose/L-ribulose 3-epimerase
VKTSISNLAWQKEDLVSMIPVIQKHSVEGIEIAPTAIWPRLEELSLKEVGKLKNYLDKENILVSGIQSLCFGHPELQVFDRTTWPKFYEHLRRVFTIGEALGAQFAVFGSPRNRIKGEINNLEANKIATGFFENLIPILKEKNIRLTLEPNAREYGADFLTNYTEVKEMNSLLNSTWVVPQIDTGCMWLAGDNLNQSFSDLTPAHIHLSVPHLGLVPGNYEFEDFLRLILASRYQGWIVVEMLSHSASVIDDVDETLYWLQSQIRMIQGA